MNDATPPPGIGRAQAVMREMLAAPRITEDYWKAADKLELEYINQHVDPEIPLSIAREAADMGFPSPAWTATALWRNALPNNGLAVWWSASDEYDCESTGFWTDIDGHLVDL